MYASFYKLKKEPFHITPDPDFLFLSPSHKEALGSMIYGIGHKKGFVLITGEVGVGKTTIIRSYLQDVDKSALKLIYIFNSNLSFHGLLKTIYKELGIIDLTDDVVEMVNQLHYVLIEEYRKGLIVVLIIDEAQNMPVETLENMRMLSNLETSTDKLIQIVFSGQPEFERKLEKKELRQLKQRIAVKATIRPLTPKESRDYILHRLRRASAENSSLFTDAALRRIIREARGIPRVINILCENALVTALGYRKGRVTSRIAGEVISDFNGKKEARALITALASAAIVIVALAAFFMYADSRQPSAPAGVTNSERVTAAPKPEAPAAVVAENPPAGESRVGEEASSGDSARPQGPDRAGFPVVRVVKSGDTLARLVNEVYGYNDRQLLNFIKENNSGIHDVDRIVIGEMILFPAWEKGRGRRYE